MKIASTARYCIGCGYRLHKTIGERCPECGRGFSMCDRATWAASPWRGRVLGVFTGPLRRVDVVLAISAMVVSLTAYATPGRFAALTWAGAGLWVALGMLWILRWCWWQYNIHRQVYILERGVFWRSMAVGPTLWVVTVALIAARVPVRLGFMVSRSGLESARNAAVLGSLQRDGERWAGVYTVRLLDDPANVVLTFGVVGDRGAPGSRFVYVPDGILGTAGDPSITESGYVRLSANWFVRVNK